MPIRTGWITVFSCLLYMGHFTADAQQIGATSYSFLPFVSKIYRPCWQCTAGMDPVQLFYTANPHSSFLDLELMEQVRALSAAQSAAGIVPTAGLQRWEDTYEASFPAGTFPGEPSWIQADRAAGNLPGQPEYAAWRNFVTSHPQYTDVAYDGGTMPPQPGYFRSWGGSWGYISPLTPLDAKDCPQSKPWPCTWGDKFAYRWAMTTKQTGGYGLQLSDFTDGQPYQDSLHDMNPRIVAAFSAMLPLGAGVPTGTTASQSAWINKNAFNLWTDFLDQGYAAFYAALAQQAGAAAGHPALVIGQCSISPAFKRTEGVDERIVVRQLSPDNFMCIWDDQVTQIGRGGPIVAPPMQELAGFVLAAAREPLVRNGANLESDDAAYWQAIASFYPGLSAVTQQVVGMRLLKRLWLWSAWAHIADRDGNVRRALAFASRDYWDVGNLQRLEPLAPLIHNIVPVQPFGAAIYYPVSVERTTEAAAAAALSPGEVPYTYLPPQSLQGLLDGGAPVGYYVSDAALPSISQAAGNTPSAWLLVDPAHQIPPAELSALKAIAPVATSQQELANLPGQPLQLSAGLAGFGFHANTGQVVLIISNPDTSADASGIAGTVQAKVGSGRVTVTDLFTGEEVPFTEASGVLLIHVNLSPWDTQVLGISLLP